MAPDDLEKAFLQAAEIAKKLPENLQESGFNRALEALLGGGATTKVGAGRRKGKAKNPSAKDTGPSGKPHETLLDRIDRTAYPDVGATRRLADRALKVLQIADRDYGVDGLTAGDIAAILSRKFRLPAKANSVFKALERETDTVDVRGSGTSRVFHIMEPGEAYLERLRAGDMTVSASPSKRKRSANRSIKKSSIGGKSEKSAGAQKGTKRAKTTGRPGPKAAVTELIAGGYFDTARIISDIQSELQHRRGHGYTVQELSPALVRSVRDKSLTRDRNPTGQYEYRRA